MVAAACPGLTAARSSVFLAWAAPHPATLHGEMLGYRLGYGPRYADMEDWRWTELPGDQTRLLIEDLHPFTQYLISLQVRDCQVKSFCDFTLLSELQRL